MKKPETPSSPSPAKPNGFWNRFRSNTASILSQAPNSTPSDALPAVTALEPQSKENLGERLGLNSLADLFNFLITASFAFKSKEDFVKKLATFVRGNSILGNQIKEHLVIDIIHIRHELSYSEDIPVFPDARILDYIKDCNGKPSEEAEVTKILSNVTSLVRFFYNILPVTDDEAPKNLQDRMIATIDAHPQLFGEIKSNLRIHCLGVLNQQSSGNSNASLTPESFYLSEAQLSDLDSNGILSHLFRSKIPMDLRFPQGDWIESLLSSCLYLERGQVAHQPNLPIREINLPDSKIKSQDLDSIVGIFNQWAPVAFEAVKDLFRVMEAHSSLGDPLDPLLSLVLEDLMPDGICDTPANFNAFLRSFFDKDSSPLKQQAAVAQCQLNFRKSISHNPELWNVIGVMALDPTDPQTEALMEIQDHPYVRTRYRTDIHSPTEHDVRCIALTTLSAYPEDLPTGFTDTILHSTPSTLDLCQVKDLLLRSDSAFLIRKGIENILRQKLPSLDSSKLAEVICTDASEQLSEGSGQNLHAIVDNHYRVRLCGKHVSATTDAPDEKCAFRWKALDLMQNRFSSLFESQAPYAITEDEFECRFGLGPDRPFPSTYFDGAKVGLIDKRLVNTAKLYESEDFETLRASCIRELLHALAPRSSAYLPHNVHFAESGTAAFGLLKPLIRSDDQVLITSEEYGPLLDGIDKDNIIVLPDYRDFQGKDPFLYQLEITTRLASNPNIRFMLVSEVGRRGTLFPMDAFDNARQSIKRPVHLVMDGCQSFGRRVTRLDAHKPDVYFGSAFKGTDIGVGGFSIFSKQFTQSNPHPTDGGSKFAELLPRLQLAAHPLSFGLREFLTIPNRQRALQDLSSKFVLMVQALNRESGQPRIRILAPSHGFMDRSGNPVPQLMTGIFECEVVGCTRTEVSDFARHFGVIIAPSYEFPLSERSFRIAFHPHMGNESILILGYVLAHCGKN